MQRRCFPKIIDWLGHPFADSIVPVSPDHLLRLIDSLRTGTLNDTQREMVQTLRDGILALVDLEAKMI